MGKAKEIEGLDCGAEAFHNIELILRARLEEMCALNDRALAWTDIEGVHDMRVASRRLRSALRDFAPYLYEGKAPRKRLKEIAASLGAVRDEDVAIVALEKLRRKAEDGVVAGIELIIGERRVRRARAREHLKKIITDEALDKLQEKFTEWLPNSKETAKNSEKKPRTRQTFEQIGRETILARFKEVADLSGSLLHPFEVEPLHLMRIAAKRLRYALELFATCFGDKLAEFAKEIAALQTSLGELHDCDVWIADLGARIVGHDNDKRAPNDGEERKAQALEQTAALWLLQYLVKERTKHFCNALARWSKWEAANFYSQLEANLLVP